MAADPIPDHYYGNTAKTYEHRRAGSELWEAEQAAVRAFLSTVGPRRCLDVPVGTGRFFPYYAELGVEVVGLDISDDMLVEAIQRARSHDRSVALQRGSIFDLPFADDAFDAVVCFRLLTWFDLDKLESALAELARISSGSIIASAHSWKTLGDMASSPLDAARLLRARSLHKQATSGGEAAVHRHAYKDIRNAISAAGLAITEDKVLRESKFGRYRALTMRPV